MKDKKTDLPYAKSFFDLIVYQKARELQRRLFEVSKSFPREEAYSLTDQIRRASRSIGAQVAEAWAKREYERHFLSKLTDADAEQMETQHWIITTVDCTYISREDGLKLFDQCREIGRLLGSMKEHSADFCQTSAGTLRDSPEQFFTTPLSNPFASPTDH
ncbi:MAG: four helix bundle protein [Verrucomicrobiales bacterium]|nr:four helix bundle protein [Verrucomicrobiales bacterium]